MNSCLERAVAIYGTALKTDVMIAVRRSYSHPGTSKFVFSPPMKPKKPKLHYRQAGNDDVNVPLVDRFGPQNIDDLAVHSKKIAEVCTFSLFLARN